MKKYLDRFTIWIVPICCGHGYTVKSLRIGRRKIKPRKGRIDIGGGFYIEEMEGSQPLIDLPCQICPVGWITCLLIGRYVELVLLEEGK